MQTVHSLSTNSIQYLVTHILYEFTIYVEYENNSKSYILAKFGCNEVSEAVLEPENHDVSEREVYDARAIVPRKLSA